MEDGRGERASGQIGGEDLVPVHVPGKDGGDALGDVPHADDVGAVAEGEPRRPHRRPLEAVVHAEEGDIVLPGAPPRLLHQVPHAETDVTPFVGKPEERHPRPPHLQSHGARAMEDVDEGMDRETLVGDAGALMVAGNHHHGDPVVGETSKGLEGLGHQRVRDARVVEHVAGMDHHVHLPGPRRLQGPQVVGKKVVPAPAAPDAGGHRMIEAQMGIGDEEDPDGHGPPR